MISESITAGAASAAEHRGEAENQNAALHLVRATRRAPSRLALVLQLPAPVRAPAYREVSFAELEARCDALASGLDARGLARGDRVSLFLKPGVDFVALTFALFKLGAVPVLIDPGMGRARLLACIEKMRPRAFIGVPLAHALRALRPQAFRAVELWATTGSRGWWGTPSLDDLARPGAGAFRSVHADGCDEAAVLFTSGSTGPPKGVTYTHGNFAAQIRALRALYSLRPGEVDLACFPLFALLGPALELTSVIPDLDPSRPARCDPSALVRAIVDRGVEQSFGSPAIWRRVFSWCRDQRIQLPTLRRLMIAGAPVAPALVEAGRRILPDGEVYTPYGATEALPVASARGRDLLELFRGPTESGAGTCIGRPAPEILVRIVKIQDSPIETWSEELCAAPGEIGEICVSGPAVTPEYKFDAQATRHAKFLDGNRLWHRMGDLGRVGEAGELWFQGRLAQRLETARGLIGPVSVENIFNTHPAVGASALVGMGPKGSERAVLIVAPERKSYPRRARARRRLARELLEHGGRHPAGSIVQEVRFRRTFPLDVRHNAKIDRESLKRWAEGKHA